MWRATIPGAFEQQCMLLLWRGAALYRNCQLSACKQPAALARRLHPGHCAELREARLPPALPARGYAAADACGGNGAGALSRNCMQL